MALAYRDVSKGWPERRLCVENGWPPQPRLRLFIKTEILINLHTPKPIYISFQSTIVDSKKKMVSSGGHFDYWSKV